MSTKQLDLDVKRGPNYARSGKAASKEDHSWQRLDIDFILMFPAQKYLAGT